MFSYNIVYMFRPYVKLSDCNISNKKIIVNKLTIRVFFCYHNLIVSSSNFYEPVFDIK